MVSYFMLHRGDQLRPWESVKGLGKGKSEVRTQSEEIGKSRFDVCTVLYCMHSRAT